MDAVPTAIFPTSLGQSTSFLVVVGTGFGVELAAGGDSVADEEVAEEKEAETEEVTEAADVETEEEVVDEVGGEGGGGGAGVGLGVGLGAAGTGTGAGAGAGCYVVCV